MQIKRGDARAQFTYTDKSGVEKDNVAYIIRENAMNQYSTTGTWYLPAMVNGKTYNLTNAHILANLVIAYLYKDDDGLSVNEEMELGTNPQDADSDHDGIDDFTFVTITGDVVETQFVGDGF